MLTGSQYILLNDWLEDINFYFPEKNLCQEYCLVIDIRFFSWVQVLSAGKHPNFP